MESEKRPWRERAPSFEEGALSLQTSLSHRELPPYPRHLRSEKLFRFQRVAGTWGKFFVGLGGADLLQGAAIALFLWGGYVSRVYLARVPLTSNIHPMRNDTWVVPYNISFPMDYALCRGAIQRERPANYPALRPSTNLTHFYPVAERNGKPLSKSRSTGFGSEQPEFAAWNTATPKSAQTKRKREKPLCDEGLEGS